MVFSLEAMRGAVCFRQHLSFVWLIEASGANWSTSNHVNATMLLHLDGGNREASSKVDESVDARQAL